MLLSALRNEVWLVSCEVNQMLSVTYLKRTLWHQKTKPLFVMLDADRKAPIKRVLNRVCYPLSGDKGFYSSASNHKRAN